MFAVLENLTLGIKKETQMTTQIKLKPLSLVTIFSNCPHEKSEPHN